MRLFSGLLGLFLLAGIASTALLMAAPTPEQRKELTALSKELTAIRSLITKKEFQEAEKQIEALHTKAEKLIKDADFSPTDRAAGTLQKNIAQVRQQAAKGLEKPDPTLLSFSKDIAPILASRCRSCHDAASPRGSLDLSSYAGMKRGGTNGALLIPKQPARSLIMARVVAPDPQQRMPRGANPLAPEEIQKLALWIEQGAGFDGMDEATPLTELARPTPMNSPTATPVVINKATGNEKVSFVKDIAPTIVNLCTGCHGNNNPRAGLSLLTFESLMRGSENGRVIVPGSLDGSRLWALVGAGEQPRMPQGQARITRQFHAALQTWIEEGAKFDGSDAKTPLRQLVPTEEQMAAEKLAMMTPEEMKQLRETRTQEQWKRFAARSTPRFVNSNEFYVYGDVSEERLKQVDDWAEAYAREMRSIFGAKTTPIWKGRLTIFVIKDRFGYSEFNQVIHERSTPRDLHGHAHVTTGFEDAYIAVEDVGDAPGETHGGLHASVVDHLTGAWLKQPGARMPEWVIRGTGLAMAARTAGANDYFAGMNTLAAEALKGIQQPGEVFSDRFGPGDIGPIGYTLVEFMIRNGGAPKFGQFVSRLQGGAQPAAAVNAVYAADLPALGTAYLQSVASSAPKKGKAK